MRSTRASAAVERLRVRSGKPEYSLSVRADGRFVLRLASDSGVPEVLGEPLPMDEFVRFVDGIESRPRKPDSKLDSAFRTQLRRK